MVLDATGSTRGAMKSIWWKRNQQHLDLTLLELLLEQALEVGFRCQGSTKGAMKQIFWKRNQQHLDLKLLELLLEQASEVGFRCHQVNQRSHEADPVETEPTTL